MNEAALTSTNGVRQIVLDTETTGLEVDQGHRIIEIGCVEIMHRRVTGETFQPSDGGGP